MLNILLVCTGNSCRSVMGEALLNHLGAGRIAAYSAGSHPTGKVNIDALATLERHGLATDGYKSQALHEFSEHEINVVITVCDNAAEAVCPGYLNSATRVNWGLNDPSHVEGSEGELIAAFEDTYRILEQRIQQMLTFPLESMTADQLNKALNALAVSIN